MKISLSGPRSILGKGREVLVHADSDDLGKGKDGSISEMHHYGDEVKLL
jgi:hypothetical protein